MVHGIVSNALNHDININNYYEQSRILYSLRGVLIFNDEGHKRNQQFLMNKFQDNRYATLVRKEFYAFTSKKEDFNLSPFEAYLTTHF